MSTSRILLPATLVLAATTAAQDGPGRPASSIGIDEPVMKVSAAEGPSSPLTLEAPTAGDDTDPQRSDLGFPVLALDLPDVQDPPPKKAPAWKGSVTLGAYQFEGNTVRRGTNLASKAEYSNKPHRTTVDFGWDYAEERGPIVGRWELQQRRTTGGAQQDWFFAEKSYAFVNARATGDTQADLELRFVTGAGIGHQWADEKDLSFKTEVGISYVSEDFRSGARSNEYAAARVSYGLEWQLSKTTRLLQDVEVLPSLEESDDVNVFKSTRLRVGLTESMVSELKWELDYDNTPSPGFDRIDHRFFLTVGWTF